MTNYSVKYVLKAEKINSKGLCPIYLKITISRKAAYISTRHFVLPKEWNEKTQTIKDNHPNVNVLNIELAHRKSEVITKIVEMQVKGNYISAKIIKEQIVGKELNNIFHFIDAYCLEVTHKKSNGTIDNYRKIYKKLKEYHKSDNLNFEDITPMFLGKYENSLRQEGLSNNYIHSIWKILKTFFNKARKRKLTNYYPFNEYENPIYKAPDKDYLTLEELNKLEAFAISTEDPILKETVVWFLFACYTGLRVSDWYLFDEKKHTKEGMLRLKPFKTKTTWVEMPISAPLARNLERMKQTKLQLKEPTINEKLKIIAKKTDVEKYITTHTGRHTFAVTFCLEMGLSSETAAELMGITLDTFNNYSQITPRKIHGETSAAWGNLQ